MLILKMNECNSFVAFSCNNCKVSERNKTLRDENRNEKNRQQQVKTHLRSTLIQRKTLTLAYE